MLPPRSAKNVPHESSSVCDKNTASAEHCHSRNPIIRRFLDKLFTEIQIPPLLPPLSKEELYSPPPAKRQCKRKDKIHASSNHLVDKDHVKRVADILKEFKNYSDMLDESKGWKLEDTSRHHESSNHLSTKNSVNTYLKKGCNSTTTDSGISSISSDLVTDDDSLSTSSVCTESFINSSTSSSSENFSMPSLTQLFTISPSLDGAVDDEEVSPSISPVHSETDKSGSLLKIFTSARLMYDKNTKHRRGNTRKPYKVKLDAVSLDLLRKNQSHLVDVLTKRELLS